MGAFTGAAPGAGANRGVRRHHSAAQGALLHSRLLCGGSGRCNRLLNGLLHGRHGRCNGLLNRLLHRRHGRCNGLLNRLLHRRHRRCNGLLNRLLHGRHGRCRRRNRLLHGRCHRCLRLHLHRLAAGGAELGTLTQSSAAGALANSLFLLFLCRRSGRRGRCNRLLDGLLHRRHGRRSGFLRSQILGETDDRLRHIAGFVSACVFLFLGHGRAGDHRLFLRCRSLHLLTAVGAEREIIGYSVFTFSANHRISSLSLLKVTGLAPAASAGSGGAGAG